MSSAAPLTAVTPSFLNEITFNQFPVEPIITEELGLSPDNQLWVEQLIAYGLLPKASSAATCKKFFREILTFADHYRRLGKTTCHLMSCRNCGTGGMRAHRLWTKDESRFHSITEGYTRTMWLSIMHDEPTETVAEYWDRVYEDMPKFRSFMNLIKARFADAGWLYSVELDPKRRYVAFRVYYVGHDMGHGWIERKWRHHIGQVGVRPMSDTRCYSEEGKVALRWVLDSFSGILALGGSKRAEWEFYKRTRLSNSGGTLRGTNIDHEGEPQKDQASPNAPYGYCPCGCGGVIERSQDHKPHPLDYYKDIPNLDFGPLRDYAPYSPKVNPLGHPMHPFTPPEPIEDAVTTPSPPPW